MTLKDFFHRDRFALLAGIELLEAGDGKAKSRMLVTEHHLNGGDVCQGGALFTLADLTFAAAVNSHGRLTVSTTSNISFFRPVSLGSWVFAEAQELVDHHRLPYAEVRLTDKQGRLVALFTSSGYRKDTPLDTTDE